MNTWFQQTLQFFREAYAELRKVAWLSRKEVIASTIVVIVLVILVAIYVGIADFILARILGILI